MKGGRNFRLGLLASWWQWGKYSFHTLRYRWSGLLFNFHIWPIHLKFATHITYDFVKNHWLNFSCNSFCVGIKEIVNFGLVFHDLSKLIHESTFYHIWPDYARIYKNRAHFYTENFHSMLAKTPKFVADLGFNTAISTLTIKATFYDNIYHTHYTPRQCTIYNGLYSIILSKNNFLFVSNHIYIIPNCSFIIAVTYQQYNQPICKSETGDYNIHMQQLEMRFEWHRWGIYIQYGDALTVCKCAPNIDWSYSPNALQQDNVSNSLYHPAGRKVFISFD